jgi:hypothetical protein
MANGGRADLLRKHLQELRRRVERDLGLKGIEIFIVETNRSKWSASYDLGVAWWP